MKLKANELRIGNLVEITIMCVLLDVNKSYHQLFSYYSLHNYRYFPYQ